MNRIVPTGNIRDAGVNMKSISVMPNSNVSSKEKSFVQSPSFIERQPRKSLLEPFKLFGKIPTNMKKSEVMSSDNFLPKFLRFLNADEYTTYDTKYSKTVIVLAVMNAILLLTFFIFVMYYYSNHSATNIYVKKELITDEFKEKNKELDSLNDMNMANTILSGIIGGSTFLATILQFIYVFTRNDFK